MMATSGRKPLGKLFMFIIAMSSALLSHSCAMGGSKDNTWSKSRTVNVGLSQYGGAHATEDLIPAASLMASGRVQATQPRGTTADTSVIVQGNQGGANCIVGVPAAGLTSGSGMPYLFDGAPTTPCEYPATIVWNGHSYLLFLSGVENIPPKLFVRDESGSHPDAVNWLTSTDIDMTALSGHQVYAPFFSAARQTLYFTRMDVWPSSGCWNTSLYQSVLSSGKFGMPGRLAGDIDPFAAVHYKDGQARNPARTDHPISLGRLVVTKDGKTAFFTMLCAVWVQGAGLKSDDCYVFPTPNNYDHGGVADWETKMIWNAVYRADIEADGSFSNVRVLGSSVNRPGMNFVCDISPEGDELYVAHWDPGVTIQTMMSWGWDPGNSVEEALRKGLENMPRWAGQIDIFTTSD